MLFSDLSMFEAVEITKQNVWYRFLDAFSNWSTKNLAKVDEKLVHDLISMLFRLISRLIPEIPPKKLR